MAKIIRKQSSIENLVFDLETLQQVDNNAQLERGDLSLLSTFDKSNLVHAINEVNAETDNNKNSIDDINELIGSEKLGTELFYYTLQTVNKTLINAINEVNTNVNTLDNSVLKKTDNLLSLSNKSLARTNLDVYNKTETEQLLLNAAFGGITVEDLTNMAADIEKAKKNYFFGLDLLGSLR